jgi:hypothetical protein
MAMFSYALYILATIGSGAGLFELLSNSATIVSKIYPLGEMGLLVASVMLFWTGGFIESFEDVDTKEFDAAE